MRQFLLSPASTSGKRAQLLLNDAARFDLALRIRQAPGAPLGEVFSFLSGLYFRGKITYARQFAAGPDDIRVITSNRGLVSPDAYIMIDDLRAMASGSIDHEDESYRVPLERDALALRAALPDDSEVVLLGSIATETYVRVLADVFGQRLVFPGDFVGRGDMSRGGLMLRCARDARELDYASVMSAIRRGTRPPRLG